MQQQKTAEIYVWMFLAMGVLGVLAWLAIPHLGQLTPGGKAAARATEYRTIRIAVAEMLNDSSSGALVPAGPTADMSRVRTADAEPLVLTDYLNRALGRTDTLGCRYVFDAGGEVVQVTR